MLFSMIQKIFNFWKKKIYPTGGLMTSYHVNTKITKMSPLFFSLFLHKKHFYEQNMLVTPLLEQDYIGVLTKQENGTSGENAKACLGSRQLPMMEFFTMVVDISKV